MPPSAVPTGTGRLGFIVNPGLRPGLLSDVPSGLNWNLVLTQTLNVVSQEVIDIELESSAADGRQLVEASMRSVPVVLMNPGKQIAKAFGGVLVETGVSPLANGSLDKALGFAVGAWGVDASAGMSELEIATGLSE